METWKVNVSMWLKCLLFYSQTVNFSSENPVLSIEKNKRGEYIIM